ncbi:MAG: hypothetical protein LBR95_06110 [Azoarcus sp.]|jgi:hypothetical protein|nr:hypothetical protein [Azoarcus sp.]
MRSFGYDESALLGLPGLWLSAWTRPWGVFGDWNALWGDWAGSWRRWLESAAAMPAAWVPALADERQEQPASIAFFLPWLPRIEARIAPLDHDDDDAVRVMLRATLPGGLGGGGLEVDATVRRYREDEAAEKGVIDLVSPADGGEALKSAKPDGRKTDSKASA